MNTLKRQVGVEEVTVFSGAGDGELHAFRLHEQASVIAAAAPDEGAVKRDASRTPSRLWWWVVAAFLLQLGVWTAWITLASHHRVQEVPLATQPK